MSWQVTSVCFNYKIQIKFIFINSLNHKKCRQVCWSEENNREQIYISYKPEWFIQPNVKKCEMVDIHNKTKNKWEINFYIFIEWFQLHHHHHHHVMPQAHISLTFSRHFSLSFIVSGRSSGLHPVSSYSCCMYVPAGHPAICGCHRSTSLMSSSLLLQQCPACLVRLTWILYVVGGKWSYSWCLVGFCRQDLFDIARNIWKTIKSI